jgi:flagellar motor protein MotB
VRRIALGQLGFALLLVVTTGCGRIAFTPNQQSIALSPQQQQTLAQQTQLFQQRAGELDRDNRELESLLAQSRQHTQLLEDQLQATQTQLRDTAGRLASIQTDNDQLRTKSTALVASLGRRNQAEIRSNNSLIRDLAIANLPGVKVRQDGDVIRVELPADQLFEFGSPQLKVSATNLIRSVGVDLERNYPEQIIGIEGHTDNTPSRLAQYPTPHHLSTAQATAIYDALVRSAGVPPRQLFVVGHGANHPLVSNATPQGQASNRRIEIVVYPETVRR